MPPLALPPRDEVEAVERWRYAEAKRAGLTRVECTMYAQSDLDAGDLRKLVATGWSGEQISRVLF